MREITRLSFTPPHPVVGRGGHSRRGTVGRVLGVVVERELDPVLDGARQVAVEHARHAAAPTCARRRRSRRRRHRHGDEKQSVSELGF